MLFKDSYSKHPAREVYAAAMVSNLRYADTPASKAYMDEQVAKTNNTSNAIKRSSGCCGGGDITINTPASLPSDTYIDASSFVPSNMQASPSSFGDVFRKLLSGDMNPVSRKPHVINQDDITSDKPLLSGHEVLKAILMALIVGAAVYFVKKYKL